MRPLNLAKWSKEIGIKCHYCVDLIPPPEGFPDTIEEEIIQFLECRPGAFDVNGEIANGGAYLGYCFEHVADAEAFHGRFAAVAEKAILKKAS